MTEPGSQPLQRRPLRLELGSGGAKRDAAAVAVDVLDLPGVDVVGDAYDVLESLADGSVDDIYSEHFLEHIPDLERLLREAARVLRTGGTFRAVTPHFSSPYFYSDPTHTTFFGMYTFGYYLKDTPMRRKVPQYIEPLPFDLARPVHVFKSPRPFYVRYAFKRLVGLLVNALPWIQEFYEENLCWLVPCYEIQYELRRQ